MYCLANWLPILSLMSRQNKAAKNICIDKKVKPGLALTSFRTILPCFQQVNLA